MKGTLWLMGMALAVAGCGPKGDCEGRCGPETRCVEGICLPGAERVVAPVGPRGDGALADSLILPPDNANNALEETGVPSYGIIDDHIHFIYSRPDTESPQLGRIRRGGVVRVVAVARGPGCKRRFLEIEPRGYICEIGVKAGRVPAIQSWVPKGPRLQSSMPYRYLTVRKDDTPLLRALPKETPPPESLVERKLARKTILSINRVRRYRGVDYFETQRQRYVAADNVLAISLPRFAGLEVEGEAPEDTGWVIDVRAFARDKPGPKAETRATLLFDRLRRFKILETVRDRGTYYRIKDKAWFSAMQVARLVPQEPPEEVGPREKWIDVNLTQQTVVAYEGRRMVYATICSTGVEGHDTPPGKERIRLKAISILMEQGEGEEAYHIDDVPWTMFFKLNYALHGCMWHDNFGKPRSHGCVNLSPMDARWFFYWSSPHLPEGWHAVEATADNPGTLVWIHDPPVRRKKASPDGGVGSP